MMAIEEARDDDLCIVCEAEFDTPDTRWYVGNGVFGREHRNGPFCSDCLAELPHFEHRHELIEQNRYGGALYRTTVRGRGSSGLTATAAWM